jgi:hypothetical protein
MAIKNAKQLETHKQALQKFSEAIEALEQDDSWEANANVRKVVIDGMRSQCKILRHVIRQYERGNDDK